MPRRSKHVRRPIPRKEDSDISKLRAEIKRRFANKWAQIDHRGTVGRIIDETGAAAVDVWRAYAAEFPADYNAEPVVLVEPKIERMACN